LKKWNKKTFFSHLYCTGCGEKYNKNEIHTVCKKETCKKSLFAAYDLPKTFDKTLLKLRETTLWRYREFLPVEKEENRITLGEGMTPLFLLKNLGASLGLTWLYVKDESNNPTGSFKARGLCMAVSKAKEFGIQTVVIPTAGNAGGALSAYAAKAGMKAYVFMPVNTPQIFKTECQLYNAQLTLVDGLISDCGKMANEFKGKVNAFDMSTLKEPYRVEGKKTMGYELAEQLNWEIPDVILYPTGGGTGLIGIWKAFDEMEQMGWISSKRPRMVVVQAEGCKPIVDAFHEKSKTAKFYANAQTFANGLRVPLPYADHVILDILVKSNGTAVAVSDEEIIRGMKEIAAIEGLIVCPEGAALLGGLRHLLKTKWIKPEEKILLINTGSGYKYLENLP
jgi:threonine synthase